LVKDLLGILRILILLFALYRYLRKYWLRRLLEKKKKEKRTRKPAVLRPKSERVQQVEIEEEGDLLMGQYSMESGSARNAHILDFKGQACG
jgi:hypothetical protein